MTNDEKIFDVFLSHSHSDAIVVEALAKQLEDEFKFRVWLDKWVLIPGESWEQEIARGLDQAKSCAVCIGKETPEG
ncbi:TIR domain protein [uncultured archaeon]|nr:TIR domain protein [uncultured archaeon]